MYTTLLFLHSAFRWLVLASLLYSILKAANGILRKKAFTAADDLTRHTTATIAHIQLALGYVLYFKSPLVLVFRQHYHEAARELQYLFFGAIHISLMTLAVILITIGSSVAKRRSLDRQKFSTMLVWFIIALFIIFIAIPWPFSPFAQRPLIRTY